MIATAHVSNLALAFVLAVNMQAPMEIKRNYAVFNWGVARDPLVRRVDPMIHLRVVMPFLDDFGCPRVPLPGVPPRHHPPHPSEQELRRAKKRHPSPYF